MHNKLMAKMSGVLLIIFILTGVFSLSAFAEDGLTAENAHEAAIRELEVLKDMGLVSDKVRFEGEADSIYESEEYTGDEYWFGRVFPHRFCVRWDVQRDKSGYGCNLYVDADSGKLSHFSIDAVPEANTAPVLEKEWDGQTLCYYDNFEDIFSADMTVEKFCTLLAEYWGFDGFTIADTHDELYGQWEAVSGDTLLKNLPSENADYYVSVFFDGDQQGVPRYIQLCRYAGYVSLFVGTGHTVG